MPQAKRTAASLEGYPAPPDRWAARDASDGRFPSAAPLVSAFLDETGAVAADRVAESFAMSKAQLAETVGLAPEALYKTGRVRAPKTRTRLTEMLEVLSRVADWAGGRHQAMAWYRAQPIPAFGGRTAESLVKSGQAAALRDYLDHIATGGFA